MNNRYGNLQILYKNFQRMADYRFYKELTDACEQAEKFGFERIDDGVRAKEEVKHTLQ
ncbi:MAG TPA: hypothetical protein VMW64_03395 [Dehalococcoidia bacterium]|nr:hypothetical protein [Dehalococcoidia bacterium]